MSNEKVESMIQKPNILDPKTYFKSFIDQLSDEDLLTSLQRTKMETIQFLKSVPSNKEGFRYAENKWTLKQVALHIVDCERILSYRALCLARKEQKEFPGFDEGLYAENDFSEDRSLESIYSEFELVRNATIALMKSLHPNAMDNLGIANNISISPKIMGWFIAGHNQHHLNVIKERYI